MTTSARQRMVVAAAVESLHPEYRQVLVKAYFQRHSAAETAYALDLPVAVVKRRIYEAMHQLREILAEEGVPLRAVVGAGRLAA
jgi:DNA-directed RNA polymerase specialized sigma24 family protein